MTDDLRPALIDFLEGNLDEVGLEDLLLDHVDSVELAPAHRDAVHLVLTREQFTDAEFRSAVAEIVAHVEAVTPMPVQSTSEPATVIRARVDFTAKNVIRGKLSWAHAGT